LVELVVVVAVLALLAVFAVPKAYDAINSSRQTKVAHDLVAIQGALERHYADLGYYPVKLNDLTAKGYLRRDFRFKSPANKWYFYAVDDTRTNTSPHAYILGAPGSGDLSDGLYRRAPLPEGFRSDWSTYAWKHEYSGRRLYLYNEGDTAQLPTVPEDALPASLELYRTGCLPDTPEPCDVYTN
jgi:type II secretory pathway pseudopilin PulG